MSKKPYLSSKGRKLMTEKVCKRCGDMKPMGDYYVHSQMADGHLNICKECTKARVKKEYFSDVDHHRTLESERYQRRKHDPQYLKRQAEYTRKWRTHEKQRAHNAVGRKLARPQWCELCGAPRPWGHHEDYKKQLDVIWVCPSCHGKITRKEVIIEEKLGAVVPLPF